MLRKGTTQKAVALIWIPSVVASFSFLFGYKILGFSTIFLYCFLIFKSGALNQFEIFTQSAKTCVVLSVLFIFLSIILHLCSSSTVVLLIYLMALVFFIFFCIFTVFQMFSEEEK